MPSGEELSTPGAFMTGYDLLTSSEKGNSWGLRIQQQEHVTTFMGKWDQKCIYFEEKM